VFVYEISRETLNGFAPNSLGRRVWFLARTSLNVKIKGQRSRSPGTNNGIFGAFGGLRAAYVKMFSKTSLASSYTFYHITVLAFDRITVLMSLREPQ